MIVKVTLVKMKMGRFRVKTGTLDGVVSLHCDCFVIKTGDLMEKWVTGDNGANITSNWVECLCRVIVVNILGDVCLFAFLLRIKYVENVEKKKKFL